ncbi:MAG: type I secretion protein [Silicimonas sp.]|nr:type I secretion protein [Silicimonas sp.]
MPTGFLVSLGDGILSQGDTIVEGEVTFTTDQILGAGEWLFRGRIAGQNYNNVVLDGTYYVGTDGSVYFVPDDGPIQNYVTASVFSAPPYQTPIFGTTGDDQPLLGTASDDIIYGGEDTSPSGTGNDSIDALEGDDTVYGGDGNDTIIGGFGADELFGGDGDDVIRGGQGTPATSQAESLNWSAEGADEASIGLGFTQNTGLMDVNVLIQNTGNFTDATVESNATQYTETGEPFSSTSALEITGAGLGLTATTILTFSTTAGSEMTDEVQNVSFRINDIDTGGWQDVLTITAFDADGNEVPVTITPAGNDTVSGNTITAGPGGESGADASGSALVEIAGPVERIEIAYSNADTAGQLIYYTDIHFETIPITGDPDTLYGGVGDDTLFAGDLDIAYGEDGDDLFQFDPSELSGGSVTIIGGEGGETTGDTLDLSGLLEPGSIVYSNSDDTAGGFSGTATLTDGTIVTFSEIENIICFTAGTLIRTPLGERRIDTLEAGDIVLTADDGPQPIRWIGKETVRASGSLAPVRFLRGAIGNTRELLVSPQHRMICSGHRAQLHFGEREVLAPAKSLVDDCNVTIEYGGMVTYVHMLFDRHQIVIANGAPSESFYPGGVGLDSIEDAARAEVFRLFPELRSNIGSYGPASRLCVKPHEARAMVMAM